MPPPPPDKLATYERLKAKKADDAEFISKQKGFARY